MAELTRSIVSGGTPQSPDAGNRNCLSINRLSYRSESDEPRRPIALRHFSMERQRAPSSSGRARNTSNSQVFPLNCAVRSDTMCRSTPPGLFHDHMPVGELAHSRKSRDNSADSEPLRATRRESNGWLIFLKTAAGSHRSAARTIAGCRDPCSPNDRLCNTWQRDSICLNQIGELNVGPAIHGILVQLPLPPQFNIAKVLHAIDIRKDVDGIHLHNVGGFVTGNIMLPSCTAYGVMKMLEHESITLEERMSSLSAPAILSASQNRVKELIACDIISHDRLAVALHVRAILDRLSMLITTAAGGDFTGADSII